MNIVLIKFEDEMIVTLNSKQTIPQLRRRYVLGDFAPGIFYDSLVASVTITSALNLPRLNS